MKCSSCQQQDDLKANIINLVYEYARTGRATYLYNTGSEYEGKFNYIIDRLE